MKMKERGSAVSDPRGSTSSLPKQLLEISQLIEQSIIKLVGEYSGTRCVCTNNTRTGQCARIICFTSTKAQILTRKALAGADARARTTRELDSVLA